MLELKDLDPQKTRVVKFYLYLISAYLVGFFPILVLGHYNPALTISHGIGILIVIWGFWKTSQNKDILSVSQVLAAAVFITVAIAIITGGVAGSGPFLVFPYTPLIAFLRPKMSAIRWISAMLMVLVGSLILGLLHLINLPYSTSMYGVFIVNYVLTVLLVLAYANEKEASDKRAKEGSLNNIRISEQLRSEAESKTILANQYQQKTAELESKVSEIEIKNVQLENSKLAMMNILEDLNDEKAASEQGRIRDEALLKSIGEGLVVIDANGNISSVNNVAKKMLGYSDKELIGKWYPRAITALYQNLEPIEPFNRPIVRALSTGKVVTDSKYYRRKDGTTFPVTLTVSPVVLEGRPIGAIEVFRDMTKERELERAKEEFVSLASHQLRTPATGVKAYLSMLHDGYAGELSPTQYEFISKAEESNDRQLSIVDDMLEVARADSGSMVLQLAEFSLTRLIEDTISEQRPQINERNQTITFEHPKSDLLVTADSQKLRMAVENIISNASKYTPAKGSIRVTIRATKVSYLISISDTGVGIAKDDIAKLFKRFSRIDNQLSAHVGGTGLGLYLSGKIIELHGGRIRVQSELGTGSTFTIRIPRKSVA